MVFKNQIKTLICTQFCIIFHSTVTFKIYDLDNDGKISKDDLMQVQGRIFNNYERLRAQYLGPTFFFGLLDFYNMTLAYVETKFELSKGTSVKASYTPDHKGSL